MPIPTWVPGQVLAAADVNTWFVPTVAYKSADTARTSTTTLAPDPALTIPVAANVIYDFYCLLIYTGLTGGDIKWNWVIPAGSVLLYQSLHNEGGATGLNNSHLVNVASLNILGSASGTSTNIGAGMWGTLDTAGTSGSLTLQWSQNTSSGTATTVRTGSIIRLQQIG